MAAIHAPLSANRAGACTLHPCARTLHALRERCVQMKVWTLEARSLQIFTFFTMLYVAGGASALAADVKLIWDPITQPTLSGYNLYYGTTPRNYSTKIDVGRTPTYTVTGLGAGTYYFAVTAYD